MLSNFHFHHIGYAVTSIEKTMYYYIDGGYSCSSVIFDPIQNVNICFLTKEGEPMIELLEPVDENSPINKNLEKNGVCPYHCRLSISAAISLMRSKRSISNTSLEYVNPPWAMNCSSFAHSSHCGCTVLFI